VSKDQEKVGHVVDLLRELRAGWQSIPVPGKAEPKAAAPGTVKKVNVQG